MALIFVSKVNQFGEINYHCYVFILYLSDGFILGKFHTSAASLHKVTWVLLLLGSIIILLNNAHFILYVTLCTPITFSSGIGMFPSDMSYNTTVTNLGSFYIHSIFSLFHLQVSFNMLPDMFSETIGL